MPVWTCRAEPELTCAQIGRRQIFRYDLITSTIFLLWTWNQVILRVRYGYPQQPDNFLGICFELTMHYIWYRPDSSKEYNIHQISLEYSPKVLQLTPSIMNIPRIAIPCTNLNCTVFYTFHCPSIPQSLSQTLLIDGWKLHSARVSRSCSCSGLPEAQKFWLYPSFPTAKSCVKT